MITGQLIIMVTAATIQTHMPVPTKQFTIGQGRDLALVGKFIFTLDRNDGIDRDDALFAREARGATMEGKDVFTRGPGNHITGIDTNSFLPGNPFDRLTGYIKS